MRPLDPQHLARHRRARAVAHGVELAACHQVRQLGARVVLERALRDALAVAEDDGLPAQMVDQRVQEQKPLLLVAIGVDGGEESTALRIVAWRVPEGQCVLNKAVR